MFSPFPSLFFLPKGGTFEHKHCPEDSFTANSTQPELGAVKSRAKCPEQFGLNWGVWSNLKSWSGAGNNWNAAVQIIFSRQLEIMLASLMPWSFQAGAKRLRCLYCMGLIGRFSCCPSLYAFARHFNFSGANCRRSYALQHCISVLKLMQ